MNETETKETTMQELAQQYYDMLELKTRDNGESFITTKDNLTEDQKEDMRSLMYAAHNDGDMFPDDYRYDWTHTFLEAIAQADDGWDIEIEPDIYTHDLTTWLNSRCDRVEYMNEATDKGYTTGSEILSAAQYFEMVETRNHVMTWLESKLDEINNN